MAGRLAGRRIVVTGAASGMGAAITRLFSDEGAKLALLDIAADKLEGVAAEIGALALPTDVSDEAAVGTAIERAAASLEGIDALINAAGILGRASTVDTDWATFQRLVTVNLGGPFLTCRAALPHLQASGRGAIVNLASLAGIRSQPRMAVYSATKAGLIAFGEAFSAEAGPAVRVNTICPGIIHTPMTAFMWQGDSGAAAAIASKVQLGRAGEPTEVAEAALFLISDAASFVSAATLAVTGGHIH